MFYYTSETFGQARLTSFKSLKEFNQFRNVNSGSSFRKKNPNSIQRSTTLLKIKWDGCVHLSLLVARVSQM